MILSGKEIESRINDEIIIDPFDKNRINPNSYNLSLHNELIMYKNSLLDMKKDNEVEKLKIPSNGLVLEANRLYLGRTVEYTETKNLVPMLEGRSSIGRLGLFVHVTAGFGDVGFKGFWTLEIFCIQPIKIYPNVEICQVYYHTLEGSHENYNSGKYQDNQGIQPSLLYKDFENKKITFKSAVLYKKEKSEFRSDYIVHNLKDNPWIVFPYELRELISIEQLKKELKNAGVKV